MVFVLFIMWGVCLDLCECHHNKKLNNNNKLLIILRIMTLFTRNKRNMTRERSENQYLEKTKWFFGFFFFDFSMVADVVLS